MSRLTLISLLAIGATASLSAGMIQLTGQPTNVVGFGLSGGAAGTYLNGTNCVGTGLASNGPNFNGCTATNANNISKRNYVSSLFGGATGMGAPAPDAAVPNPASGKLGTFDLMNAPNGATTGENANYYQTTASRPSLIVPVGIYNVTAVDTMLNDYYGTAGHQDTTVTFCFSLDSLGSSCTNVAVALTNGVEIRSAVICTNCPANA
ncbi:MAG: hypothetical protein QOJ99_2226, partial [Bryobacterales bacterium]|nr:hypothetical protein [Bryobacterales bacterium]